MTLLLVVDDHAIVRSGLKRLLGTLPDVKFAEASNGREALDQFRREKPDLVLLDINLPGIGGIELLRRLVSESPRARVLMVSMHADAIYPKQCLSAGAAGYVSKDADPEEIVEAVRTVARGKRYIERRIAQDLALLALETGKSGEATTELTARELELVRLLSAGRSLSEMAAEFGVSYKTVANSLSAIKSKLGVTRTTDLLRIALKGGIST